MISPSLRACRRFTGFGFAFTQTPAIQTNQNQTPGNVIPVQRDTLAVRHGLRPNRADDALNGFDPQRNAMPGKCLSGNFQ